MRKKINIGLLVSIILFAGFLVCIFLQDKWARNTSTRLIDDATILSASYQLQKNHVSDSLPHYRYQHITDSLDNIAANEFNKNNIISTDGFSGNIIGVRNTIRHWRDEQLHKDHTIRQAFVSLPFYTAEQGYSTEIHNDSIYLRYPAWEKKTSAGQTGHTMLKPAAAFYFSDKDEIGIPITDRSYRFIRYVLLICTILLYAMAIYVLIGLPVNMMVRLSSGNAFALENIRSLGYIAIGLLSYFLLCITGPYLASDFFQNSIPEGFHHSLTDLLLAHWTTAAFGIVMFFIRGAFIKGYELRKEQDLTI